MSGESYRQAVEATKNDNEDPYIALGHQDITVIADAARSARSAKTDDVIRALESGKFNMIFDIFEIRREDHQDQQDTGLVKIRPSDNDAGWKINNVIRTPWQDIIDQPGPGRKFELPAL